MTLSYNKNKALEIPAADKFLLNLKHDEASAKISEQPFALFFDDTRNLHFAYVADFSTNISEVTNFSRICTLLLERQFWLKTNFDKLIGDGAEKVKFLEDPQLIFTLVKSQMEYFYPEGEPKDKSVVVYNPTIFIPFIAQNERQAVIEYCTSQLINIVVFDFLHNDIQQTEEKKFFKTIKKMQVVAKEKTLSTEDAWWNRIHTEHVLDLGTHVLLNEPGKILKTEYFKDEAFRKAALTLQPHFSKYDWANSPLERQTDLDKNIDFLKLYFAVCDSLCPIKSLTDKNYQISSSSFLSVIKYLRTQHRSSQIVISDVNRLSHYLLNQWGNKDEVYSFLDTILSGDAHATFHHASCFLMDSNIKLTQFIELNLKLKKNYPRLNAHLRAWFEPQIISDNEAGRLLANFLSTGTVEQIQMLLEIYPRLPIFATSIVKNQAFYDLVKALTPERIIAISKVFPMLSFTELKKLLELPHNGSPLRIHFRNEIGSLLNSRSALSEDDVAYILKNGPEVIEADSFAVNVAFGGYAQTETVIKKLSELNNNPRLKVSRQAWEFIRLKLYKRGIPDIFKSLNLKYE